MKLLRHLVAGFVLFAVLIGLLINAYSGLETEYNITDNATRTLNVSGNISTGNIAEQFRNLDLLQGISGLQSTIQDLTLSTGTIFDVMGGLISVGISALKIVTGIITIPFEIVNIITSFYINEIGGIMLTSLAMIVVVYVGFILLSAYIGKDV